jgi:rfaE bifunctional protein nucleotidyltransferase chain/domain
VSATPTTPRVTVVGDALLDVDWTGAVERVCPDAPAPVLDQRDERIRPGGAALAAAFAAAAGAEVTLVTALGGDVAGDAVRSSLAAAGVAVLDLGLDGPTPVKLRLRSDGQSLVRVDRGCTPVIRPGGWATDATDAVLDADAVLVSDYGRGMAGLAPFGALLGAIESPVVWDPHARGPVPPQGLDLLVPNCTEGRRLAGSGAAAQRNGDGDAALAAFLARQFGCPVALTVGLRGAIVAMPGAEPVLVPVDPAAGDPCGAGDRFAATAVVGRARGVPVVDAAEAAAAAARRHVVDGFGGGAPVGSPLSVGASVAPAPTPAPVRSPGRPTAADTDAAGLARAVRAAGGTVVVAGGCFDVLHAGHVRLLQSARRLGDCLIVCINDDLSVRRLKGRHRPVNPLADRVEVLRALGSVDAVHPFDEDDPCAALELLRPHVFVKGADHAQAELPERRVLGEWGGEIVFVPVVPGRSTTRVLEIAAGTAAS